jgi:hypothetical protein
LLSIYRFDKGHTNFHEIKKGIPQKIPRDAHF